jgi:hypothetical protein
MMMVNPETSHVHQIRYLRFIESGVKHHTTSSNLRLILRNYIPKPYVTLQ